MPFGSFHWWDLLPLIIGFVVVGGGIALLGFSIGAGFAWMQRRQEQHPENQ
jgi:hypothetical protein